MALSQRLRGWAGQRMDGRRWTFAGQLLAHYDETSGSNSYTATKQCTVIIRAWGAGGSGGRTSTYDASGGGGGASGHKVCRIGGGQTISWTVGIAGTQTPDGQPGIPGGNSTVTLPGGIALTAGGGAGGAPTSNTAGGAGGVCAGPWDIARSGGAGGASGSGGTGGTSGGSPIGGGSGGLAASGDGGGGGAAGFSDKFPGLTAGKGGLGNLGSNADLTSPGGATGGNQVGPARDGRIIIIVLDLG